MSRFIDDVSNLAIEDCLISKLSTLFKSGNVLEMSPQDVSRLAGETPESSLERQRLEAKRKTLKTGLQSLKSLNKRRSGVVSPTEQDQAVSEDSEKTSAMTPSRSEKASIATDIAEADHPAFIPDKPYRSSGTVEIPPPLDEWPPQVGFDRHEENLWTGTLKKNGKNLKASRQGKVEGMFGTRLHDSELGY